MSHCLAASPARHARRMLLVVIPAAIVGFALAGLIGLAAGAGAVLCIWFLGRMLAPPNEGQTFQEFRNAQQRDLPRPARGTSRAAPEDGIGPVRTVGFPYAWGVGEGASS